MKKSGVLNSDIIAAIAALGHTDSMVIADAGFPIPKDVPSIDISLIKGIPSFQQTLKAIAKDLVIESFIIAEELPKKNPGVLKSIQTVLSGVSGKKLPHELFKKQAATANVVIRTGESSPYGNIILIAGVNF